MPPHRGSPLSGQRALKVVILVPRRADHGHRDELWRWLRRHLESEVPWPIIEGHHETGDFSRSAALNLAAEGTWDVAVVNDADCLCPTTQLRSAVSAADHHMTIAFDRFVYLSQSQTRRVLAGAKPQGRGEPSLGNSPFAISRRLWEAAGGFDESFSGWGWEDNAFRVACDALGSVRRIPGPMYHLWHPPSEGPEANRQLWQEYQAAHDAGRMAEFLRSRQVNRTELAERTFGWLHPDEGPFLRELALKCEGPYLEVGSYCGKSTIWLGDAAETNGSVLFAVDHHQGSPEMAPDQDCHNPAVVDEDGSHDTLTQFRRTIRAAGLQDTVVPVVGSTAVLGPLWRIPVGFVFIDASHSYEGCKLDAETWGPWLKEGGLMAFHDTTIGDIARVVDETPMEEVEGCNTIRVLRK